MSTDHPIRYSENIPHIQILGTCFLQNRSSGFTCQPSVGSYPQGLVFRVYLPICPRNKTPNHTFSIYMVSNSYDYKNHGTDLESLQRFNSSNFLGPNLT